MQINVDGLINASSKIVWDTITDIKSAEHNIKGIDSIEILKEPEDGLLGLKWRETRTMMGRSATEDMWISALEDGKWYEVDAESHGTKYKTRITLKEQNGGTHYEMVFNAEPITLSAKLMSLTMIFFRGSLLKLLRADFEDIKTAAEVKTNVG